MSFVCFWSLFIGEVTFNNLDEVERAVLYFIMVFLSYGCKLYVFLPRGAVGLSVIFDCSISWSYSICFDIMYEGCSERYDTGVITL